MTTKQATAKDFSITLLVDQTPEQAFNAITNVRGWWSDALEGNSQKLNDVFVYRYKDIHKSTQKLVEVVPNKKVVWLISDSYLNFIDDTGEWDGTKVVFDISKQNDQTKIVFTHQGLNQNVECFDACSDGWSFYIKDSLLKLITTGKGLPNEAETPWS